MPNSFTLTQTGDEVDSLLDMAQEYKTKYDSIDDISKNGFNFDNTVVFTPEDFQLTAPLSLGLPLGGIGGIDYSKLNIIGDVNYLKNVPSAASGSYVKKCDLYDKAGYNFQNAQIFQSRPLGVNLQEPGSNIVDDFKFITTDKDRPLRDVIKDSFLKANVYPFYEGIFDQSSWLIHGKYFIHLLKGSDGGHYYRTIDRFVFETVSSLMSHLSDKPSSKIDVIFKNALLEPNSQGSGTKRPHLDISFSPFIQNEEKGPLRMVINSKSYEIPHGHIALLMITSRASQEPSQFHSLEDVYVILNFGTNANTQKLHVAPIYGTQYNVYPLGSTQVSLDLASITINQNMPSSLCSGATAVDEKVICDHPSQNVSFYVTLTSAPMTRILRKEPNSDGIKKVNYPKALQNSITEFLKTPEIYMKSRFDVLNISHFSISFGDLYLLLTENLTLNSSTTENILAQPLIKKLLSAFNISNLQSATESQNVFKISRSGQTDFFGSLKQDPSSKRLTITTYSKNPGSPSVNIIKSPNGNLVLTCFMDTSNNIYGNLIYLDRTWRETQHQLARIKNISKPQSDLTYPEIGTYGNKTISPSRTVFSSLRFFTPSQYFPLTWNLSDSFLTKIVHQSSLIKSSPSVTIGPYFYIVVLDTDTLA